MSGIKRAGHNRRKVGADFAPSLDKVTDLSGGWFYRKGAVNRMSIPVMVGNAVDAISKNGVVMMNVALRGDGTLPENQAAYLTTFGEFLKINGEIG